MTTAEMISIIRNAAGKDNLMDGYAELLRKYEAAKARIEELEHDNERLHETIDELENEISVKDYDLTLAYEELERHDDRIYELEADVDDMKILITEKDYQRIDLEERIAELEAENTKLAGQLEHEEAGATRTIANIEEDNAMLNEKISQLVELVNYLQGENKELRRDLEGTINRINVLDAENIDIRIENDNLKARIADLERRMKDIISIASGEEYEVEEVEDETLPF